MLAKNIDLNGKTILVTGAAGFIGACLIESLLQKNLEIRIIGIDNMDRYYDVEIKEYRICRIEESAKKNTNNSWIFLRGDLADKSFIDNIFCTYQPNIVVNLAAQAGVRYSITNPEAYIHSNVIGFFNILEACRQSYDVGEKRGVYLVYASSSSVYGENQETPYSVEDKTDRPVSFYAATKKSNELFAYAYSRLYNIPMTGLRFFSVYGPAGRPDMAYFNFTNKLRDGDTIEVFNYGNCERDFTYIDDIVTGIERVMEVVPGTEGQIEEMRIPPHKIYNIGNSEPESLLEFINILCEELIRYEVLPETFNLENHIRLVPMQKGDVLITFAETSDLESDFGWKPKTSLREGISKFVCWYKDFYCSSEG